MLLYSYIPTSALSQILSRGLYGAEALLAAPELEAIAAKAHKKSLKEFHNESVQRLKDDFWKYALMGPNAFFALPPPSVKLAKSHPMNTMDGVVIVIDYDKLKKDIPETRLFGMELVPYKDGMESDDRRGYLSENEIRRLSSLSSEELWKDYRDTKNKGYYAPDVPHVSIHTPDGVVQPKYLKELKRTVLTLSKR